MEEVENVSRRMHDSTLLDPEYMLPNLVSAVSNNMYIFLFGRNNLGIMFIAWFNVEYNVEIQTNFVVARRVNHDERSNKLQLSWYS